MPVYTNNTLVTIKERVENEDGIKNTIKIEPGKSKTTEFVLLDAGLTEDSAAPYYNPLMRTQTITSTGIGDDQTVAINRQTKIVIVQNASAVAVTAFLRATANTPGLPVPANTQREVSVGCNVNQLVLQFGAAASVLVEERK
jgi:hypothetical protein